MKISEILSKGQSYEKAGHWSKAADWYRQWLLRYGRQAPGAVIAFQLGVLLRNQGDLSGALASYQKGLRLAPGIWELSYNLGVTHEAMGHPDKALQAWQAGLLRTQAAKNASASAQLLAHMGRVLEKKDPERAVSLYEQSLRHAHTPDTTQHFLALRRQMCLWPVVPVWLKEMYPEQDIPLQLGPFMALAETDDPQELGRIVKHFIERKMPTPPSPLPKPSEWQHPKLKIGYLSADFRWHAVCILMAEVFELHDRSRFEVYGLDYSDTTQSSMRQRVIQAFDHHVLLHHMTDEDAARHIRSLEIDVLIDLTGLTASSRWPILTYQPAPVQVSYLGFPGISHIPGMTHVMVDRVLMPETEVVNSPEHPLRLDVFQANDRKRQIGLAPSRHDCGLPNDAVVYCAFNSTHKYTPDIWGVWMRILSRVTNSVLWMTVDNLQTRKRLCELAQQHGVAAEKLVFASKVLPELYLARMQCADLFLDTRPFGAGTTASDALWAGLPVLTCPGKSYTSRMAASLLTAADVTELIAQGVNEYEQLAVSLGNDRAQLDAIKQKVRLARASSKLFDTPAFVADLEHQLTKLCRVQPRLLT